MKAEDGKFDEWTQAHVDSRRGRSLAEVLAEWEEVGQKLEPMLPEQRSPFQLYDVELHEQDIRAALERPGARDSAGLRHAVDTAVSILGRKLDAAGLPAVRFTGSDTDRVAGSGEPEVTAQVDTYELVRALFVRRTRS